MTHLPLRAWTIGLALSLAAAGPVAADEYPTTSCTNGLIDVLVSYQGSVTAGVDTSPERGWFKLRSGRGDLYDGGWIQVMISAPANFPEASMASADAAYSISYTEDSGMLANVPLSVRYRVQVVFRIVQSPRAAVSGIPPIPTTCNWDGGTIRSGGQSVGGAGSETYRMFRSVPFQYLDEDVALSVDVRIAPTDVDPGFTGPGYCSFALPSLHASSTAWREAMPYLVPVGLIGRPPGNQSWSRMTATSGTGANLAVSREDGASVTSSEAFGLGIFGGFDSGEYTESRSTIQGIHQSVMAKSTASFQTHPAPQEPGEGDVLVALKYPPMRLYEAWLDKDFRYVPDGRAATTTAFAMRAFDVSGLNPNADRLTPDEKAAFRSLDPLLGHPHARLPEPRFYRIQVWDNVQGALVGGSLSGLAIDRSTVESIVSTRHRAAPSTTEWKLPIGTILSSVLGVPIPGTFDPTYRSSETTETWVELKTQHAFENSTGTLCEYQIGDSDPNRLLTVEVYYDTYFRSFLFRDAETPQRATARRDLIERLALAVKPLKRWTFLVLDEGDEGDAKDPVAPESYEPNLIAGYLGRPLSKGCVVDFRPIDEGKPTHRGIAYACGNVVLSNVEPGTYRTRIGIDVYELVVDESGAIEFRGAK